MSAAVPLLALSVLDLLRERCPQVLWHPGRVAQLVGDFDDVDPIPVAQAACDWINHQSKGEVRDGVGVLRLRLERARSSQAGGGGFSPSSSSLTAYDRFKE